MNSAHVYHCTMDEQQFFAEYKPLRNHLQHLSLEDSLFVLWAYSQHFAFGNNIPPEIEVIPEFVQAESWPEKKVLPWEIELLTREIIINAQLSTHTNKTLRKWNYFSGAVNKLKAFENELAGFYADKRSVLVELWRIAHRQFPWQSTLNQIQITRYLKIFSTPALSDIIYNKTGLTTKDLYMNGMLFTGCYLNHPSINLPINIQTKLTNTEMIQHFVELFAIEIVELRNQLAAEQSFDEKFMYAFSPLTAKPIVQMQYRGKLGLVCPIPTLLMWRITSGIFYDICGEQGFDHAFGDSFEQYVGEICESANGNDAYKIHPEDSYKIGKDDKLTADWILEDDSALLFVECKTKRIKQLAKEEILDEKPLEEELGKMADFIVQIYKSIHDFKNGHYPNLKPGSKNIYPMVLTLEHWYAFGDFAINFLNQKVKNDLAKNNVPVEYIKEMPYTIASVSEFELLAQVLQTKNIETVMSDKIDGEKLKWTMGSHINSTFPEEQAQAKPLFQNEFDEFFRQKHF